MCSCVSTVPTEVPPHSDHQQPIVWLRRSQMTPAELSSDISHVCDPSKTYLAEFSQPPNHEMMRIVRLVKNCCFTPLTLGYFVTEQ